MSGGAGQTSINKKGSYKGATTVGGLSKGDVPVGERDYFGTGVDKYGNQYQVAGTTYQIENKQGTYYQHETTVTDPKTGVSKTATTVSKSKIPPDDVKVESPVDADEGAEIEVDTTDTKVDKESEKGSMDTSSSSSTSSIGDPNADIQAPASDPACANHANAAQDCSLAQFGEISNNLWGSGKGSQCEQDDAVKGSTEVGGGGENCGPTGNQDLTNVQLNFFNDATSPMGGAIDPGDFSSSASIGSMRSQASEAESAGAI